MFSTTKVTILLLTSLLIFLAIEWMDMRRDTTAFKKRFEAWKRGVSPYEAGLKKYADGKRYIPSVDGEGWDRITDDTLADVFANLVITPTKNKTEKVVNRPGWYEQELRRRINNAGYVSDETIDWDNRMRHSIYLKEHNGELPLLSVHPEFDILMLGSGFRTNPLTRQIWKNRSLAKEMDKVFDEGLVGATKDMPVLKASDMYNQEHMLSTVKYNPKQISAKPSKQQEEYVFKSPDYPDEPFDPSIDLDVGLHEYPSEYGSNRVNLLWGLRANPFSRDKVLSFERPSKLIKPINRTKDSETYWYYFNPSGNARNYSYKFNTSAEDVPEEVYTGKPATEVIPKEELGLHKWEILNPEIQPSNIKLLPRRSSVSPLYDETYVDRNGNVNIKNVLLAVQDFYKTHPNAKPYKYIQNSSGDLRKHINDVVKSAQSMPTPDGYTRQEFIQSALFHDIGKVFADSKHGHGPEAVDILDRLGIETSDAVRNAIRHHMSDNMLDKDNLTKALRFADVARGANFDIASFRFPHLSYDWNKPLLNIPKIPFREELKTRINPWLKNKGYQTIDLNLSEEEAWKELEDRIDQHRSFLRGVRDPLKDNPTSPNDKRNRENAIESVMDKFGLTREQAESPAAAKLRMEVAGTSVPLSPTGPGRRNMLFDDHYVADGLTEYDRTHYSKILGINPETKDALYLSTSDDVLANYASAQSDNREGAAYVTTLRKKERVPGESMSEYLLKNDFDMIDLQNVSHGLARGTGAMFEDPYRLLTGRSLVSDMRKEGIILPKYIENPDIYVGEGGVVRSWKDPLYPGMSGVNVSYRDAIKAYDYINENLEKLGINFKLTPSKSGGIYMPKRLLNLNTVLRKLMDVKKNITPISKDEFSIQKYDRDTQRLLYDVLEYRMNQFDLDDGWVFLSGNSSGLNTLPRDQRDALIDHTDALEDPEYLKYVLGDDYAASKKLYYNGTLDVFDLTFLKKLGLISDKQYKAVEKAFKHGGDASKYIDFRRIADNLVTDYLLSVKKNAHKKMKVDPHSLKPTVELMIDFMKSKGVKPRYEVEGFGDNRVYVIEANKKNKTKNAGDISRTYGYIVGDKGEKLMDVKESVEFEKKTRVHQGGKDNGSYSKRKVSRKTLRTVGVITTAGSTLKPRKKEE